MKMCATCKQEPSHEKSRWLRAAMTWVLGTEPGSSEIALDHWAISSPASAQFFLHLVSTGSSGSCCVNLLPHLSLFKQPYLLPFCSTEAMLRGSGRPLQSHRVLRKQESHTTKYVTFLLQDLDSFISSTTALDILRKPFKSVSPPPPAPLRHCLTCMLPSLCTHVHRLHTTIHPRVHYGLSVSV